MFAEVHCQRAIAEVNGYINYANNLIQKEQALTASHLENFLDEMKDKYAHNADEVSNRLFGKDGIINKAYMEKMDKRNKEQAAKKPNGSAI